VKQSLLIIEPDLLTRWSLETYLDPWFDVHAAAGPEQARRCVGDQALDALIVSDAVPGPALGEIEREARRRNPAIRIIRTISGPEGAEKSAPEDAVRLEKPFDLRQLRSVLGVAATPNGPDKP
jgi:DNA-binding NtrC family response regulator